MAETALTRHKAPGSYDTDGLVVAADTGDDVNGNKFTATGRDLLRVHNTDTGAQTFTITSVADPATGRTGDISVSIGAGEVRIFGPFELRGWADANGEIIIPADAALANFNIELIELPA